MRRYTSWLCTSVLVLCGCSGGEASTADFPRAEGGGCDPDAMTTSMCFRGAAGMTCATPPVGPMGCHHGRWECEGDTIFDGQCGCFGTNAGAPCPPKGSCDESVHPDLGCMRGATGRMCTPSAFGIPEECKDGSWTCPEGTLAGAFGCGCYGPTPGAECPDAGVDAGDGGDGAADADTDADG